MSSARRALATAIGAGVIAGATIVATSPAALADPPPPPPVPGCSAGDFEQVTAQVAAATSVFMFNHPDANAYFSSLKGLPKDQVRIKAKAYLAGNPDEQAELTQIRQPLQDMKARCQ